MGGYNRALVEKLLPCVWDGEAAYGLKNEQAPDADMPKVKANPKLANTLYAHLADIKTAWKWVERDGIPLEEAQTLLMRYGLDWTLEETAALFGVHKSTIQRRAERGVGRITAFLNGVEYVDGYDNDDIEEIAA
ncbi:DNA binding protein [Streptomyces phage Goby]|uniref:DNA binding protein n=1 Tax=Streptomyces phage Goby TaxID=2182319 RepID=A0A2U8UTV7_9CAUD|nr:sigma factor [Streptomyces phage Goby]ATE85150.1 DNA binding protein [Streptomyces phage Dattran]AWN07563.1 DNA binding protein [Streptomyces phage Goby]AWN07639.1 DNA binding protein [Streptomyces phage Toma]